MLRIIAGLIPGVGPIVSGVATVLGSRLGQLAAVGLAAFIYGHHVAANSASARDLRRANAALAAQLKETKRQADAAEEIRRKTEADLKLSDDRDADNQARIRDYETKLRTLQTLGPCTIDDDFRRRLRKLSGGGDGAPAGSAEHAEG